MTSRLLHRFGHCTRPGLVALVATLALAGLPACFVDVDLGGSRLACSDGQCPSGFDCVDARCVPEGQDAGGAGAQEDAAPEPQPDAGEPDPDGAPPDAQPPDAAPPDAAPPDAREPSACDEQYGDTPGYQLCEEQRDRCVFFSDIPAMLSCDDVCLQFGGGQCLAANNADPGAECQLQEEYGCDLVMNNSQVCTCSLGGPF